MTRRVLLTVAALATSNAAAARASDVAVTTYGGAFQPT
jgi:hypothetical protein